MTKKQYRFSAAKIFAVAMTIALLALNLEQAHA